MSRRSATPRKRAPGMAPDERRASLIDAGIPLLAARGQSMTTAEVARAAGVAEGTLFRAFPDKDSLIDACLQRALDPTATIAAIGEAAQLTDPCESITKAATVIVEHFREALPVMHGVMQHGALRPNASAVVGGMFGGLLIATAQLLGAHIARETIVGKPPELAQILVGMCQASVWQYLFDAGTSTEVSVFTGVFLEGCRATGETRD